jgi:hypothetical protein
MTFGATQPVRMPFAQLLDQAVDVARQRVQARYIVAVVVLADEGHLGQQLREAELQPVLGADRLRIEGIDGGAGQFALLVADEQVPGQAVLVLQLLAVDLARQFQHAPFVLAGLGAGFQRGVGQLGIVAVVADAGGELGLVLEAPLPVAFEQGASLFGGAGRGDGRLHFGRDGGQGAEQDECR